MCMHLYMHVYQKEHTYVYVNYYCFIYFKNYVYLYFFSYLGTSLGKPEDVINEQ